MKSERRSKINEGNIKNLRVDPSSSEWNDKRIEMSISINNAERSL